MKTLLGVRCPSCNVAHADTRNARLCPLESTKVAQYQLRIHTMSRVFELVSIAHTLEDGVPFLVDRDFRIDIVVPVGEL